VQPPSTASGRKSSWKPEEYSQRKPMVMLPGMTAAFPSAAPHANLRELFTYRKASDAGLSRESSGLTTERRSPELAPAQPMFDDNTLRSLLTTSVVEESSHEDGLGDIRTV
jgi:hypothetical protein